MNIHHYDNRVIGVIWLVAHQHSFEIDQPIPDIDSEVIVKLVLSEFKSPFHLLVDDATFIDKAVKCLPNLIEGELGQLLDQPLLGEVFELDVASESPVSKSVAVTTKSRILIIRKHCRATPPIIRLV
jgi:hypothetical protein